MSVESFETVIGKEIPLFKGVAERLDDANAGFVYSVLAARQKLARQNGRDSFRRSIRALTESDLFGALSRTTVSRKLRDLQDECLVKRITPDSESRAPEWRVDLSALEPDDEDEGFEWHVKLAEIEPSSECRVSVFERDDFSCVYCGRGPEDDVKLEVDHIVPRSQGGDDHPDNFQTLCGECNRGKADRLIDGPKGGAS